MLAIRLRRCDQTTTDAVRPETSAKAQPEIAEREGVMHK